MDGGIAASVAAGGDHQVTSHLGWSSVSRTEGQQPVDSNHCQPNPLLYPYLDNISLPYADDSSANTPSNDHLHQPPYLALPSQPNVPSSRSTSCFLFSHPLSLQTPHRRTSFRQMGGDRGGVFSSSHRVSPQLSTPLSVAASVSRNSIAHPHHHVQYLVPNVESRHHQSSVTTSATTMTSDAIAKDNDQRRLREPTHFRWDSSTRHNRNTPSQQVATDCLKVKC